MKLAKTDRVHDRRVELLRFIAKHKDGCLDIPYLMFWLRFYNTWNTARLDIHSLQDHGFVTTSISYHDFNKFLVVSATDKGRAYLKGLDNE